MRRARPACGRRFGRSRSDPGEAPTVVPRIAAGAGEASVSDDASALAAAYSEKLRWPSRRPRDASCRRVWGPGLGFVGRLLEDQFRALVRSCCASRGPVLRGIDTQRGQEMACKMRRSEWWADASAAASQGPTNRLGRRCRRPGIERFVDCRGGSCRWCVRVCSRSDRTNGVVSAHHTM